MKTPFVVIMASLAVPAACTSAGGITHNAGEEWSFTRSRDIYLSPPDSIRLELRVGDLTSDNNLWRPRYSRRNEIRVAFDARATIGESRHYIWSFYLDEKTDWTRVQTVFGQIHTNAEVTWNIKGLVVFEQHFYTGDLIITWQGHTRDEPVPSVMGFAKIPQIEAGRWHTEALEVAYSNGPNGYVRLWMDGKQVIDYKGPFGHARAKHNLKIGFYEPDQIPRSEQQDKVVYFDDIQAGSGRLPEKYRP